MAMRAGSKPQSDQGAYDGENVLKNYRPSSSKRVTIGTTGKGSGLARVNAFFGNTGTSKSSELASAGYLNLRYKSLLERFGCPKTVKILQKGILPEVEKIGIIDTDLKWIIDMEQGDWKAKYGPLVDNKVFQLDEFQITRSSEEKKGKDIVKEDGGMIEDEKREIESAIINNLKDSSITILGIDSMSDYIKILDDKLDIMFWDNPKAFNEGDVEGLKQMKMVLYGKRAKWFFNMLSAIRISRKPTLLTFQVAEIPSNYVKKRKPDENFDPLFEDPTYNVKWVPLTGYKLDNVYYMMKDYSSNTFKVQWKKGPWAVAKSVIDLPNDPFGYCHIVENHADGLLGEVDIDKLAKGEKFW